MTVSMSLHRVVALDGVVVCLQIKYFKTESPCPRRGWKNAYLSKVVAQKISNGNIDSKPLY
jgi:hypothetical protein